MENSTVFQPLLCSIKEAGDLLRISEHTVRAWIYQGRLEHRKLGSRVLVPYEELKRIAKEGVSEFTCTETGK
jgi:excisionase family DNA binding protein